ncbi:peptidoglycan DD-metalloendopeptidase family protein [uncultured Winogradskyella sp.]|uniref:peptidoglycan DD-metalloendopeptidase family protein n=1 Tax=uncultured Winogradskyella sp. TaxID=395353 RepID=UPI0026394E28|nr:peptidoglycan DD-metalloendopeptidase family protein [uncultured Winogradskyella sp.]
MSLSPFEYFLKSLNAYPLLGTSIAKETYIPLDLSIHNTELNAVNVSSSNDLEKFIWNHMRWHNAKAAFGGYLEQRGIYQRSAYFKGNMCQTERSRSPEEERNIHLGLDLWIEANTSIFSPLEGIIHSFKNNTNHGDYGPTIILRHDFDAFQFYTLYGHLSLASIENLEVGENVKQGQQIAALGTAEVNGDYPPHLHFQIIKDIQDYSGDYPGVSNKTDLKFYRQNCADPNLLCRLI